MLNQIANAANNAISEFEEFTEYPVPIYRIEVDGLDISAKVAPRLMSLTLKDNRGLVVDSVDLELSDHDGMLEIPPKGAIIQVWLGWSNTGLIDKGKYKVDSISHRGAPDVLSISAMANDVSEGLKQKRERSWSNQSIQQIFDKIGAEYELKVIVHKKLAAKVIKYIAQNESDANLITRIADEHDAIATVKNAHLILLPRGASQTVSGLDLPRKIITRSDGDSHNYTCGTGTDSISGVKAFYYSEGKGKKLHVISGESEDNLKEIRYIHRDKTTAELAAKAEYNRCKRAAQKLSFILAKADPTVIPELEFEFNGLKSEIDALIWLGTNITHLLDEYGFTTSIDLELQLPDADDISVLFEGKEDQTEEEKNQKKIRKGINYAAFTGVIVYYRAGRKTITLKSGDQTKPLKFTETYKNKKTATVALKREQGRIDKAKK